MRRAEGAGCESRLWQLTSSFLLWAVGHQSQQDHRETVEYASDLSCPPTPTQLMRLGVLSPFPLLTDSRFLPEASSPELLAGWKAADACCRGVLVGGYLVGEGSRKHGQALRCCLSWPCKINARQLVKGYCFHVFDDQAKPNPNGNTC